MKDIKIKEKQAQDILVPEKDFKGYTIEEIRFRRALVAMEVEFCKTRMARTWNNIQQSNPLMPGNKASLPGKAGALALRMVNGLNYLDYLLIGMSAYKGVRKFLTFFRRRRK